MIALDLSEKGQKAEAATAFQNAESLIREVVQVFEALSTTHPGIAYSYHRLGNLCAAQHKYADAEAHYRKALSILETAEGPSSKSVRGVVERLIDVLRKANKLNEIEPLSLRYGIRKAEVQK